MIIYLLIRRKVYPKWKKVNVSHKITREYNKNRMTNIPLNKNIKSFFQFSSLLSLSLIFYNENVSIYKTLDSEYIY